MKNGFPSRLLHFAFFRLNGGWRALIFFSSWSQKKTWDSRLFRFSLWLFECFDILVHFFHRWHRFQGADPRRDDRAAALA